MIGTHQLLSIERKVSPTTFALSLGLALTGIVTWLIDGHGVFVQFTVLAHVATALPFTVAIVFYSWLHFRRTIGFRRAGVLLSGLATTGFIVAVAATGLWMTYEGRPATQIWVYTVHVTVALVLCLLIGLHTILHFVSLPERRKADPFPSLPRGSSRMVITFNVALFCILGIASVLYATTTSPYAGLPVVADYAYPYGDHPFRPSQTETSSGMFVHVDQIAASHKCMSCHTGIAKQWLSSAHRQAASDPAYVTNIELLVENKGIAATRYCEGCHAPIALLTGELSDGGRHGGVSASPANVEGVSCMSCHGIESVVHLKGVASYRFAPANQYLFAQSQLPWLTRVHNLLVRVSPEQHRRDMARPLLREPALCATCHAQFMDKDMNNWGWVKMQDEYSSWLQSPFSGAQDEEFSAPTPVTCNDCHMPLITVDDPAKDANGRVRSHHFPGANTMLPLLSGDTAQLALTNDFLQSNKLRVNIDQPTRDDVPQTAFALEQQLRGGNETPFFLYLDEAADIKVVVSNHGVGHDFPGGTIDINEAWIEFLVVDAEGREVYVSGDTGPDSAVDESAHFYRSLAVDRNGNHVWKHDLFNMVGESFRRVVAAGESDIAEYRFDVPSWVKSPLTVTATLKYRKLNSRYARWALGEAYRPLPIVDMAWDSLSIPIKIRRQVR